MLPLVLILSECSVPVNQRQHTLQSRCFRQKIPSRATKGDC